MSPIIWNGVQADFDCSPLNFPAKFAVTGDFDGDGSAEIAIAPEAPGTTGNDFWVMKYDPPSCSWIHMSPIPGHGMDADFDCTVADVAAKFAVAGDFDGDGRAEIAIAPDRPGTEGNDFWVMKFNPAARAWDHISPIPGHGFDADFDCTAADIAAKFAVVGDFDGDGRAEIAIAPDRPGSEGNDFWVMRFDPAARAWDHISLIPGHGFDADFDCTTADVAAKFAVAGEFDGDGRAEIAIAPDRPGSEGNDFWVMKFDPAARAWDHSSPIPGHGFDADFDCTAADVAAKFAVASDFDGDGRAEIAIALDRPGSEGNDFWVMKFDPTARAWDHSSPIPGHGFDADFDCTTADVAAKFAVTGDFDRDGSAEIAIAPEAPGTTGNDFWVMKFNPAARAWDHTSPIPGHGFDADFDCTAADVAAKFAVAGNFNRDEPDKIAIAPDARLNDFWLMEFFVVSPELSARFTGVADLRIDNDDPLLTGNRDVPISLTLVFDRCRRSVRLVPFPPMVVAPPPLGGTNFTTITLIDGGYGAFDANAGDIYLPIALRFASAVGDSDVRFVLTTYYVMSPTGRFSSRGIQLHHPRRGEITLAAAGQFVGGCLHRSDCLLIMPGALFPFPDK
jgi:hypothetical protein